MIPKFTLPQQCVLVFTSAAGSKKQGVDFVINFQVRNLKKKKKLAGVSPATGEEDVKANRACDSSDDDKLEGKGWTKLWF